MRTQLDDDQTWRSIRISAIGMAMMVLAATCASAPVAQAPGTRVTSTVVLAIAVAQRVPNSDLTLTFEAVVEDSRCPVGTTCIWAGDAVVKIKISSPGADSASVTLHTNLETARETVYRGTRIRLTGVMPTPTAEASPRAEDYRVTVEVGKSGL